MSFISVLSFYLFLPTTMDGLALLYVLGYLFATDTISPLKVQNDTTTFYSDKTIHNYDYCNGTNLQLAVSATNESITVLFKPDIDKYATCFYFYDLFLVSEGKIIHWKKVPYTYSRDKVGGYTFSNVSCGIYKVYVQPCRGATSWCLTRCYQSEEIKVCPTDAQPIPENKKDFKCIKSIQSTVNQTTLFLQERYEEANCKDNEYCAGVNFQLAVFATDDNINVMFQLDSDKYATCFYYYDIFLVSEGKLMNLKKIPFTYSSDKVGNYTFSNVSYGTYEVYVQPCQTSSRLCLKTCFQSKKIKVHSTRTQLVAKNGKDFKCFGSAKRTS